MSIVSGTFRGGKIELHGPPPDDWVEGTEVSVSAVPTPGEIDFSLPVPPDNQPRETHLGSDDVSYCLPPDSQLWSKLAAHERPAGEIDLTGDSPEAIAAWIKWYDDLHKSGIGSPFAEELAAVLAVDKKEELAMWDEHNKKLDGLFK